MTNDEMFGSAVRSAGDLAGVFEFDGEVGYFYLYDATCADAAKVVGAIRILAGKPDFSEKDIIIRWDSAEAKVALFVRGQLLAGFDGTTGAKYGGNYCPGAQPEIPAEITHAFGLRRQGDKP